MACRHSGHAVVLGLRPCQVAIRGMDFALRGALELSDPVGPGRSRGASERGATRREERGRERQVAPAVGARARRVSRAGGYASSVSFADRNSRVTLRVTVLPFYPVPSRSAGSRDNTLTSADRSGKDEAGSLRTGRIPLSRWRHGVEPRWDYAANRWSGAMTVHAGAYRNLSVLHPCRRMPSIESRMLVNPAR